MARPPLPPLEGYVLGPRERLFKKDFDLRRAIVEHMGMYDECPRARCRRARACRSPGVACFDEEREVVTSLMCEFIYEGYRLAPEEWEEED